jgi:hypothetical protein
MMVADRVSIFEGGDDVDLTQFKPKAGEATAKPDPEQVRAVSEAAHFPSRQIQPPAIPAPKRKTHHRKTGRTAQLAVKVRPEYLDRLYATAESQKWLVGETVERALDALKREIGEGGHGS